MERIGTQAELPVLAAGRFPLYFRGSVVIETAAVFPVTDVAKHLERELERLNANEVRREGAVLWFSGWKRKWFPWRDIPSAERTVLDQFRGYIGSAMIEVHHRPPGVLLRYRLKCPRLLAVPAALLVLFVPFAAAGDLATWEWVVFTCVLPGIWLFNVAIGAAFTLTWFNGLLRRIVASMHQTP